MRTVNIIIAMSDASLANAYKLLIENEPEYQVVTIANSREELMKAIPNHFPDIIFIQNEDQGHPTEDIVRDIKQRYRHVRIGILTSVESSEIFKLLKAGADSLIDRWRFHKDVYLAIEALSKNESVASPKILKHIFDAYHLSSDSPLSQRETEVMQLFAEGYSYTDIAHTLTLSPETVRSHAKNIYTKLRVNNKTEAINKSRTLRYIL